MSPRMENPIPAAISVKKLAQNSIFSLRFFIGVAYSGEGCVARIGRGSGGPIRSKRRSMGGFPLYGSVCGNSAGVRSQMSGREKAKNRFAVEVVESSPCPCLCLLPVPFLAESSRHRQKAEARARDRVRGT